jgi:hypothetical protein
MKANNGSGRKHVLTDRLVQDSLAKAAADAVEAHRKAGAPLVVWADGRPALISPDEALPAKPRARRKRKDLDGRDGRASAQVCNRSTPLHGLQWINVTRTQVTFKTIER